MKNNAHRILASLVMLAFVNFMFSNVIFTHVHQDQDGRAIAHSHPYLPSSGHSHSSGSLGLIANFNLSAASAEAVQSCNLTSPAVVSSEVVCGLNIQATCGHVAMEMLRGPPALV